MPPLIEGFVIAAEGLPDFTAAECAKFINDTSGLQ